MSDKLNSILGLIGKKGYEQHKPVRPEPIKAKYVSDPRWIAIDKSGTDEEIYQAMKNSGLIDDYPEELKS